MTGTSRAGSYRSLLSDPVVVRTFALALAGRLGYAVLPLTFLFTVRQATGSFTAGATAMAVFGGSAFVMPLQARLTDRFGQRRVLPLVATGFIGALVAGALLASHPTPVWTWVLVAAALGLTAPALGPGMRAQWRRLTPEGPTRTAAYSLDAVCEETLYLVGPVVAAMILAHGPARHGLLLVAALIAVGVGGLAASPVGGVAEPEPARDSARRGSPLARAGMRWLLMLMGAFGVASALMYTGVAARADAAGHPGWAGYVESVVAGASVVGGLLWGRRAHTRRWATHLTGTFAVLACSLAVATVMSSWWLLGAALVGAGLAVAPTYTVAYLAADEETPPHLRTEASTWVTTVTNLGSTAGTAVAGLAVAHGGAHLPLGLAAGAALVAALLAWASRAGGSPPSVNGVGDGRVAVVEVDGLAHARALRDDVSDGRGDVGP